MNNQEKLQLLYFKVVDIWQRLCEKHSVLLDLTCDEYSLLLNANVDDLSELIQQKEDVISEITQIEQVRYSLLQEIQILHGNEISTITDLIILMESYEKENNQAYLYKFNSLLIDIIEKVQEQNKKNQVFLNKAIHSLNTIKSDVAGKKNYQTYNAKGSTGIR